MRRSGVRSWHTPREAHLRLRRIGNNAGVRISVLPNGSLFAIEHGGDGSTILVNQVLGSPLGGGMQRLWLRTGGAHPANIEAVGPHAQVRVGLARDRIVWEGTTGAIRHVVTLRLLPNEAAWLWHVDATNAGASAIPLDAILGQDLGLGVRAFVTNNEAYASQYIDHHVARDARRGPIVMSRQNLAQDGRHPWVMHGCLDGASAFATDALQLFGSLYRDAEGMDLAFGMRLADRRLQHEVAYAAIQSPPVVLAPGESTSWRFFALYEPDHPAPSGDGDLARLAGVDWQDRGRGATRFVEPRRSVVQDAVPAEVASSRDAVVLQRYPERFLEETEGGRPMSFFVPDAPHNRHVALRAKERLVTRRHGAILRTGEGILPGDATLCATCWMHGVFAAQLTIGNTSFHKLFSVSRDPYNIMRASGLRILVDAGTGWRLLTVPSAFEMGLSDCRWTYVLADRVISVHGVAASDAPAMQWRILVDDASCRLLVFAHVVLGEREYEHRGIVRADVPKRRFTFRPDPASLFGQRYPDAVYHLVVATPDAVDAIGGDELLYADSRAATGSHVAIRTTATREFCFAVVGSLTDAREAARLASRYAKPRDDTELVASASRSWTAITRGMRVCGGGAPAAALDASLPWLAHDAMIHLTVPHGLEQYTGAAWGTRDVCQGPVEFLLALEHDEPVARILRIVFGQQYAVRGDWPQWFMLDPYSSIQDPHSHGDVIVWPLKALNDYVEATGDFAFLAQTAPWCDDETLARSGPDDTIAVHVEKLLSTVRARFVSGTHLVCYGEGDWNDSLQPADPRMREAMVSSWTVALLYQQLSRYASILERTGRIDEASRILGLAMAMREDFNRFLVRDGAVAGYALFGSPGAPPELLLHPSDVRTGLRYSLLPMTRSIIAGLFTPEQARHHARLIREHLLFPDGARLMDRPVAYHGGIERTFRRAESAAFFGREIGLMYVHAHLRYGEAMAVLGEPDALWEALEVANPVAVTDRVANAAPRQRNAYFSSSDAAFDDRYVATDQWTRVKAGTVAVEGGWRVYSSGPGLYMNLLIRYALGRRRAFGVRVEEPVLPATLAGLELVID
ncbi:MAG: GH36-type glycosyl hydrolase domain-containing protein [Rudaea sp.]